MTPEPPDLADLRAFDAVARRGSVRAAAEALGLAQPSVTARVQGLERAWGTRLFVRRARGMDLTPEGRALLPGARAVLEAAEALARAAGAGAAGPARGVRIGSGDALGRGLVPRALARLLRSHPVPVHVREGSGRALVEALREGDIDLALVPAAALAGGAPGGQVRLPPGLAGEAVVTSAVGLLVPPGDRRGGGRGGVRLASLRDAALVMLLPGSSFRAHVEAAFAALGWKDAPAVSVEVGSWSLVRRYVEAGLGVAPVPAIAFATDRDRGRATLRPLTDIAPVAWWLLTRAGVPLPPATSHLHRLLTSPPT